jgi:hypothetical protein
MGRLAGLLVFLARSLALRSRRCLGSGWVGASGSLGWDGMGCVLRGVVWFSFAGFDLGFLGVRRRRRSWEDLGGGVGMGSGCPAGRLFISLFVVC